MSKSISLMPKPLFSRHLNILSFVLVSVVFYWMAYYSVSGLLPNSIPIHHDDYSNYSLLANGVAWSWIRPLSTWLIYLLSSLGPDWLIWTVRILTATYVFLCWKILIEVMQPRQYWITLALFAMASLSSPIVAEYARYTGMVTHMMSGCLGLAAVYCLFKDDREENDNWLYVSVALLLLSTLAKEDFILFYAFSFAYILLKSKKALKKRPLVGLVGLVISLLIVAGSKFFAASPFLGISDAQSPYLVDISPSGVAATVWRYLRWDEHPVMAVHGRIISMALIFSSVVAMIVLLRDRTIPKTLYIVGAILTLIAPYSVLPNHVNPYYELIWLPFIITSVYVALTELLNMNTVTRLRTYLVCAALAAFAIPLYLTDTPRRLNVAHWYDTQESNNTKVFKRLEDNKAAINASPSVCVYGANSFSPWYMHGGQYLDNVMDLHTKWNIVIDKTSPLYPGFLQGAAFSKGRIVVITSSDMNTECLKLSLTEAE
ncbi:hypothetical protein HX882_04660 [Pseudomonas gingeri]|uniref:Glycosyltransferase RgtA/B/C/D-like domain-containing protein n=1 Tax=Pseudomonas gingeri TaxID=117681 RepID=A0A7Y7X8E0_9PSED|nr:hypothetical protein [Pseudomonas gingeri]NWB95184.1 hypothetical protein [Pseudomonas gingeri]